MMVIEKVHGLQATGLSLNDRFTMLAAAPEPRPQTPRRRLPGTFFNQNNSRNRYIIEQIARRLQQQTKRQTLRQRLGVGPGALRRFGSESSLPGLRRSNSFGNLSQLGVKNRITWRQSNGGTLNRSASFGNLSQGAWRGRSLRGFRLRGVGNKTLRGRYRGGVNFGRINRGTQRAMRGRGAAGTRGARGAGAAARARGAQRARRGAARARGRGGIMRNQAPKPVPTKEELDLQLDQYMAGTKSALDAELDSYMKNAMDLE